MESLKAIGVPDSAMTFLRDHTEIDQGHNKMMAKYVDALVKSDSDLDCITYAMATTGYLYEQMLTQAIMDAREPSVRLWNWEELNADQTTPRLLEREVA
jgi:pyrroloquinoline quinone (PQQ) biosynthesis protein C